MRQWNRAVLGDVELEYLTQGAGEPVVLIHAGMFADWFDPLLEEPGLAGYTILSYHRIGYAGSSPPSGTVGLADQAAHCRALMRHVGIERAHVVGHSSGGSIALQLALDAPESVHSLVLLEPALFNLPSPRPLVVEAVRRYEAGDREGAIDARMRAVCGPAYREIVDRVLPAGAFEQAVADADHFFGATGEQRAVAAWMLTFGPEQAARISQPVLAAVGAESLLNDATYGKRQEALLAWLPNAKGFVLEGANHLLQAQNPRGMAEAIAAFLAGHSLGSSGRR